MPGMPEELDSDSLFIMERTDRIKVPMHANKVPVHANKTAMLKKTAPRPWESSIIKPPMPCSKHAALKKKSVLVSWETGTTTVLFSWETELTSLAGGDGISTLLYWEDECIKSPCFLLLIQLFLISSIIVLSWWEVCQAIICAFINLSAFSSCRPMRRELVVQPLS